MVGAILLIGFIATALFPKLRKNLFLIWRDALQHFMMFSQGKSEVPLRHTCYFVFIPFILYAMVNGRKISPYDNYGIQLTTASLILNRTFNFAALLGQDKADCSINQTIPSVCDSSGVRQITPLGVLIFSLPIFFSAHTMGANLKNHTILWRLSKWTASLIAAASLSLFFLVALRLGSPSAAMVSTLFVGTGSALLSTVSQGLWSHDGVIFGLLLSLYGIFAVPRDPWRYIYIGVGWSLMFASRLTSIPMIGCMAVWILIINYKLFLRVSAIATIALIPWLYLNHRVWGNWLGGQATAVHGQTGVFTFEMMPEGLYGLTFGPSSGFFIFQTWALLLFCYSYRPLRASINSQEVQGRLLAFLSMGLSQLLVFSAFYQWSGQQCWGTRYLTEVVPLAGLATIPLLSSFADKLWMRRLAWILGSLAFLIHFNGIILSGSHWYHDSMKSYSTIEKRCLDWKDPAFLYPISRWVFNEGQRN